ncbi:hypothetical protein [Streptomyces shenzhenensis]|uniref:Uncharacterized protein n=1 Tax=Streptomyces shenzhenensis TaxID=943815 RepID=A0A3M0I345_9ACTN|nr:hypothetical protein [Streptomyces shenzhenensis]RMB80499.1 hypothetical protein CTZ28_39535 [Streptomyces shenzhenensis]
MRDFRDDERQARLRDPRERLGRDEQRKADGPREGGRPERRGVPELDERQRQVRMARVAEQPFG